MSFWDFILQVALATFELHKYSYSLSFILILNSFALSLPQLPKKVSFWDLTSLKIPLFYLYFFWPHHAACRNLVPWPEIKPMLPALEAWSANHWTANEVPTRPAFKQKLGPVYNLVGNNFHSKFWRKLLCVSIQCCSWDVKQFFFFFFAAPHSMWDLSSLTRDQSCTPLSGSVES